MKWPDKVPKHKWAVSRFSKQDVRRDAWPRVAMLQKLIAYDQQMRITFFVFVFDQRVSQATVLDHE
jgi:hypothetical protein